MELYGQPISGLFGYSHLTGGYAGGQAEYVRVPFSDVGPIFVPDGLDDDEVLFLSDILPTGWQAAENADIEPGDTAAVWGCGPVELFAVQSAFLMGAARVIAIDHFLHRRKLARKFGAETVNFEESKTYEALIEMTGGIGLDAVIDAVGLEAHGFFVDDVVDQIKASMFLGTDRIHSIRHADRPDSDIQAKPLAVQSEGARQGGIPPLVLAGSRFAPSSEPSVAVATNLSVGK